MGELLSDPAAPRDAGNVDLLMAECSDEAGSQPRERRRPRGERRRRRAADARHVKDDRRRIGQRMEKWLGKLPVRADSVE